MNGSLIIRIAVLTVFFASPVLETGQRVSAEQPQTQSTSSGFKYRFPKFSEEANPIVISKPNGERFTFLRTGKTTCGKYVVAVVDVPPGGGPPPHIHYASDEWFYPFEGTITLLVQTEDRIFRPGQIPGENVSAVTLETLLLPAGELAYGPTGMVHSFKNETNKTSHRFINFWAPGDGMVEFIQELDRSSANVKVQSDLDDLLIRISSKWGVPHSPRNVFVKEIIKAPKSGHAHNNHAKELEELIRSSESCNPAPGSQFP